ncbi:hypothetical protein [Myxococcus stipitatus]|uniref:hypothetical protein n=1 Tax=Myxococcus stipitatus TaxID=83455 RepID=UPI0030D5639C
MSRTRFAYVWLGLLGMSCRVVGPPESRAVRGEYQHAKYPEDGVVVLSTRFSTDCHQGESPSADFWFRSNNGLMSASFPLSAIQGSVLQAQNGNFIVRRLEAGLYDLMSVDVVFGRSASQSLRASFLVEPGEVVYLGEFQAHMSNCDGFPALGAKVSDFWVRDQLLLQDRVTNLRLEGVVKRLLTFGGETASQSDSQ